jgi:hypothetical protein
MNASLSQKERRMMRNVIKDATKCRDSDWEGGSLTDEHPSGVSIRSKLRRFNHRAQLLKLVLWTMSKAYRIVFECPKGGHNINFQRKCSAPSLSDIEAMEMFGDEQISCTNPDCGWHGKASKTKLLRILPFYWVLSPTI